VTTFETELSDQLSLCRFQTVLLSLFSLVAQKVSVKPVSGQEADSAPAHGWFLKLQAAAHLVVQQTGVDSRKLPKTRGLAGVVSAAGMEQHVPS
jgi:hypothetical protein